MNKILSIVIVILLLIVALYLLVLNDNDSSKLQRYENNDISIAFSYPENIVVAVPEQTNTLITVKDVDNETLDYIHSFSVTVFKGLSAQNLDELQIIAETEIIPKTYTINGEQLRVEEVQIEKDKIGNIQALKYKWYGGEGYFTTNNKNEVIVIDLPYYLDPNGQGSHVNKIQNTYQIIKTLEIL